MKRAATSITITDPLVKYQSLLATGQCCPDPAQHRLALHLQKIYRRLKDYSPAVEYGAKLEAISNALAQTKKASDDGSALAVASHPIWRNPLFKRLFAQSEGKDSLALTRVLHSHEAAIQIDSPQGLFLSGEVGTGKSMLLDLLAEGLPTSRKKRWHFNTFMLHTLSQLERYRMSNSQMPGVDQHYSLLWMAREMVEKSPVLFLDEFQFPDRAASKILSNLFTGFFQLGGVLVASSNRMPEDLEKATGFEHVPPAPGGLLGQVLGMGRPRGKGDLFGSSSDFANFLQVLKARCEFWQMEGAKDWRRRESGVLDPSERHVGDAVFDAAVLSPDMPIGSLTADKVEVDDETGPKASAPKHYFLAYENSDDLWASVSQPRDGSWTPSTLVIYGRTVKIPRQCHGVALWDFEELVSTYGPADYITMASTFHTFIVDNIPVLTIQKKNEARRLITLLDALYEARCKLFVRARAGPDDLFFPENKAVDQGGAGSGAEERVDADAIHSETVAEAYQDSTSPFRPNISTYVDPANAPYDPDQDTDFGLSPHTSRLDFSNTGAFTGEDERFAYKRAASRLWELCSSQWHARSGTDWWQPLPTEARHWERNPATKPLEVRLGGGLAKGDVTMGEAVDLEEPAGLQGLRVKELQEAAHKQRTE